ncbi:MAG: sigma-54-dependent Fis family transcriptional regulator [Planctomycetes bacterium]|nr:sigma-54-dependent Fis family transcriptional regulator [Planctomycetota bacterium]
MLVQVQLLVKDRGLLRRLQRALAAQDVLVSVPAVSAGDDGLGALLRGDMDVVVVEESLVQSGLTGVLERLRDQGQRPDLVVITEARDASHHTRLMGEGARAVLGASEGPELFSAVLAEIVSARARNLILNLKARDGRHPSLLGDFATQSPVMAAFVETVRKLIPVDTTLLIQGETGVGKERLARVIHYEGMRRDGPFVTVNCAAIPDNLLESELFGHERGSFTSAERSRRGRFEQAHGGTIFLDEIGEMPMGLQPKLLRVLQEREVERIGGDRVVPIDIRVIAATNKQLESLVQAQSFRSDLYYRLAVVTLDMPPLRERAEDISRLAAIYLGQYSAALNKPGRSFNPAADQALQAYAWPGNVRELMNVVERAVLLAEDPVIGLHDLPDALVQARMLQGPSAATPHPMPPSGLDLSRALGLDEESLLKTPWSEARSQLMLRLETWYLTRVLQRCQGRVGDAARMMGLSPRSLYSKMRQHGLDKRQFKDPESK